MVRVQGSHAIVTKGNTQWRSDKTKEMGFGLLWVGSCGKVNMWEKSLEDKGHYNKVFMLTQSPAVSGMMSIFDDSFPGIFTFKKK